MERQASDAEHTRIDLAADLDRAQADLLEREAALELIRASMSESKAASALALAGHESVITSLTAKCAALQAQVDSLEEAMAKKSSELVKAREFESRLCTERELHASTKEQAVGLQVELTALQEIGRAHV